MKNICFLLIICICYQLTSQELVSGRIIDLENGKAIADASVKNIISNIQVITNKNGYFSIKKTDSLTISAPSYLTRTYEVKAENNLIIALQPNPENLHEVRISSLNLNQKKYHTAQKIDMIPSKMLLQGDRMALAPVLNTVPGVFMQSGALNTNRITIRGIGSRNPFGTVGIRAFYDDIPLTDGNGNSAIEDLELAALARIEIHKGPAASVYGAGLGGTILLLPKKAQLQTTTASLASSFGSFGNSRFLINATHSGNKSGINLIYSNTQSDGYRENNNYDRQTMTATADLYANEKNTLRFAGSFVQLKAFIPSSLNQTTFINNPKAAAPTWKAAQGFEDSNFGIAGVNWTHQYTPQLAHKTSVFTSVRTNDEPRPFNILTETSVATGIRSRLVGDKVANSDISWSLGGELFYENASIQTFENLYQEFPAGTGSVQGMQLTDFKEQRYFYNLFAQMEYVLLSKWIVSFGINSNQTLFKINDQLRNNPIANEGTFDFGRIASPKLGWVYTPTSNLSIFGSIAHGFNTPTTEETLLPDGLFNPNLQPETGWNFELGLHMQALQKRLQISTSGYLLAVKNLLVNRRGTEDQFFAINAGKTNHVGLEFDVKYQWFSHKNYQLTTHITTSLQNFKFIEFIDLENDYSGNILTGNPSGIWNMGIDFSHDKGGYGRLKYQYVGSMPVNDANTIFSDSYQLLNLTTGYQKKIGKLFHINLFAGIQNGFDTRYASQLQVNARGFGNNAPRYFYPGNPLNFFGGINIKYSHKN